MFTADINKESMLELFNNGKYVGVYSAKDNKIFSGIVVNGELREIEYNYIYIPSKGYRIEVSLYSQTKNVTNFIGIPERANVKIYVKDSLLHIDYQKNDNIYTVFGIDVTIDAKIPHFFIIEQSDDYGLVFTEKDLKELEMFEGIFVNNTRILFSELHWIYIEKDSRHYCTVLTLSDIDCDLGDVTIDLTDKSHINIYIDSESNIHIDIK